MLLRRTDGQTGGPFPPVIAYVSSVLEASMQSLYAGHQTTKYTHEIGHELLRHRMRERRLEKFKTHLTRDIPSRLRLLEQDID